MATASAITFSKFRVLLGDGASPEVFSSPCGFNSRALNRSKNLTEVDLPDCDNEDAPAWVSREVRSLTWSVTGEGVLAEESVDVWEAFFDSNDSQNVRIEIEFPNSTEILVGAAHLASYNITGTRGERVTVSVDLQGNGALLPGV
jgi:predicted secreted protein